MSDRLERILDLVDAGLQRSPELGGDGGNPAKCWRCQAYDPVEGSEAGLCELCRAFLLEEGPDPLRADGLIAYIDAELFTALQDRLLHGDGQGVPMGISPAEVDRIRAAVEQVVEAAREIARFLVDAFASIDWPRIAEIVEQHEEARRAPSDRRTLPPARRGARPTARPTRDLRATEAPRSAPTPRRRTP